MARSLESRLVRSFFALVALSALLGCDNGINVLNVTPLVTAVGPISLENGEARIVFWVYDYEEDAVDAVIEVERGGSFEAITPSGGHGLNGLTSSREDSGRAHIVTWQPTVGTSETISLRVTITDDQGATSVARSGQFTLDAGLADPQPTL